MREPIAPDRITEIRLYRVLSAPEYAMLVYHTDWGQLYRIDTLEPWEPTDNHRLEETVGGQMALELSRAIDKALQPAGEC